MKTFISSAIVQIGAVLLLCGHGLADEHGASPNGPNERIAVNTPIKAGFGIEQYQLGMPIDKFGKEVERTEVGYFLNRADGIALFQYEGRVTGLAFNYRQTTQLAICRLSTDKGIDANASVIDIQEAYGEPSTIILTTDLIDDKSFVVCVDVAYKEFGIEFQFRNGKLAAIQIMAPKQDFDYARERKSFEKYLVYIRGASN